jgi:hypothetical protein
MTPASSNLFELQRMDVLDQDMGCYGGAGFRNTL